ncbi:hypothetical protein MMC09_005438 [Bachmanniomyces sp. S44760]|nr:hypothetical protein [Bachmanniomyces sp. S44760]
MSSTAATPRRGRPSGSSMAQPQSATSVGQSRAQLPPYEPPSQPLNPTAQFALQNLSHTHKLDSLKGHIRTANNLLAATAGEANDRLVSREGEWARKKAKREQNGSGAGNDGGQGEDQEGEKEMVDMRIRVQTLTDQLEEKVRGMVDLESGLEANEKVLADIGSGNAGGGKVMATQSSLGHSQFRQSGRRGRRGGVNGDDDEVDGGGADEGMDGNEDLMGSEGVADQFKKKLEEHEREYARLTMQSRYVLFWIDSSADAESPPSRHLNTYKSASSKHRYAGSNSYINFKRTVHDARHPGDDAPPLPHASTWFAQPNSRTKSRSKTHANADANANGNTSSTHQHRQKNTTSTNTNAPFPSSPTAINSDSNSDSNTDSDLEIATERITLNCPLTLLPLHEPLTSRKCPHSFEASAITEMLSLSNTFIRSTDGSVVSVPSSQIPRGGSSVRPPPAGTERGMKCPVCSVMLTLSDLGTDPVLMRKIKRAQAAADAARGSGMGMDGLGAGAGWDSDDDDGGGGNEKGRGRIQAEEIESGDEDSMLLNDETRKRKNNRAASMRVIKNERLRSSLASPAPALSRGGGNRSGNGSVNGNGIPVSIPGTQLSSGGGMVVDLEEDDEGDGEGDREEDDDDDGED